MKILKFLIFIISLFTATCLFAQPPKAIENDLLASFKKISYWENQRYKDTSGKWVGQLEQANKLFAKTLKSYIEKYPSTITYPFRPLKKEYLDISSSTDGLFRIYSWDTLTGGTMHFFDNVFQYKAGNKTVAIVDTPKSEADNFPNYHKLYTLKTGGATYYLAVYLTIGSSTNIAEGIQIFTIQNGKLNRGVKLIKTTSGMHSDLNVFYHYFSVSDWGNRKTVGFNPDTKTIYLPLVTTNGTVTNKYITYKFTGQYFEKVKN